MEVLSLMAMLDFHSVPKWLLRKAEESFVSFATSIGTLQAFSLISVAKSGEAFAMHPLVQLAIRTQLEHDGDLALYQEEALVLLANRFPEAEFENWEACETLFPHAQAVSSFIPTADTAKWRRVELILATARFDTEQGRYLNAWQKTKNCLESGGDGTESTKPTFVTLWSELGIVNQHRGEEQAAEDALWKAHDLISDTDPFAPH